MNKTSLIFVAGLIFTLAVLGLYSLGYFKEKPAAVRRDRGYRITLEPMEKDVELRGQAMVVSKGDSLSVQLSIRGTRPSARYNSHLHEGECSKGAGGGIQLPTMKGVRSGTATVSTLVPLERLNLDRPHLIMVHRPDGNHALCGNLPSMDHFE